MRRSGFENHLLLAGSLSIAAGVIAAIATEDPGGLTALLGWAGLGALVVAAASNGARRYRAGGVFATADMRVRRRPVFHAVTVALALGLPAAAVVVVLGALDWGWLLVAAVLLISRGVVHLTRLVAWMTEKREREQPPPPPSPRAEHLLERLCMRADTRAPEVVVAPGPEATAWTTGATIHVTQPLLELLDDGELEAVLAHEPPTSPTATPR